MRFDGYVGDYAQVAFDNNPYITVIEQNLEKPNTQDHFRTFWVDVPEGTQTITFNGPNGFLYWRIKDISLWADQSIETSTSTSTPTLTPTNIITPTSTATITPTSTAVCYPNGTILYENEDIIIIRK